MYIRENIFKFIILYFLKNYFILSNNFANAKSYKFGPILQLRIKNLSYI